MRRIVFLFCLCYLVATPAAARMYQWQNPATGTTQLSGTPPAWYRGTDAGPRVYVFDNNQLLDDTGVKVSDAQREALRAEAFGAPNAVRNVDARDTPARDIPQATASPVPAPLPSTTATAVASPAGTAKASNADKAASLKALIDAWDQHQLDQARSLLERMPADGKSDRAHP